MLNYNLGFWGRLTGFLGIAGCAAFPPIAFAQNQNPIRPDATLGAEASTVDRLSPLLPPEFERVDGGAIRGQNLFHSLEEFGVSETGGVYFIAPSADIANIFARVTGNNPSEILGVLGTLDSAFSPTEADLFLINPNGIIFGENAALNLGGSFTATTASEVQFGDAGEFSAVDPENPSTNLSINPSAYFFNLLEPGDIINRSNRPDLIDGSASGLRVPNGEGITLIGGNISIEGGNINANGGQIELGAATGGSVVQLNNNSNLIFQENASRKDVIISNGSLIISVSNDGGAININASNISFLEESITGIGVFSDRNSDNGGIAGDLSINATGNIRLDNQSIVTNQVITGRADAGRIIISAENIEVLNGSQILGSSFGQGNAGDIFLDIDNLARFEGFNPLNGVGASGIFTNIEFEGVGQAGDIRMRARDIEVANGAQLISASFNEGNAGNIVLEISGTASFTGANPFDGLSSGAKSSIEPGGTGEGGNVEIIASNLEVTNGGQINASNLGEGDAGNLILRISQDTLFKGVNPFDETSPSGAFSIVESAIEGQGGNIELTTSNLEVIDGALLSTSNSGMRNAGDFVILVRDTARFQGFNPFNGKASGLFSNVNFGGCGQGGNVELIARNLEVSNGAQILSGVFGEGQAGNIYIIVTDSALFRGFNPINNNPSLVGSTVEPNAFGQGGNVEIIATNLKVTNGAQLSVSTFGIGDAGNLILQIRDTARFDGENPFDDRISSGAFSSVQPNGEGQGGNIELSAGNLELINGARISTESLGIGNAGNISIIIQNQLIANEGTIGTASQLNEGGQIAIMADKVFLEGDSDIQTFVESGVGGGGNIDITANVFIALNDTDILAYADDGIGGNITLRTLSFFGQNFTLDSLTADPGTLDVNDQVDINATGAVSGVVTIPDVSFVENSINELAEDIVVTEQLLAGSCIARSGSDQATFTNTGSGGLPVRPGDAVLSSYNTGNVQAIENAEPQAIWQPGDPIVEPTGAFPLTDGRLVLSRECDAR